MQHVATRPAHICIALIAILLFGTLACGQDVTEPSLKAAFIYNMAKFTEWPDEALYAKHFVMCVIGDDAIADALDHAVKGRSLGGNSISVSHPTTLGQEHVCHLLYLSGMSAEQAAHIVKGLRGAPVLTISDIDGFTTFGGMAQFFFEHGQLRFSIGLESARSARLQLSAKILSLAIRK